MTLSPSLPRTPSGPGSARTAPPTTPELGAAARSVVTNVERVVRGRRRPVELLVCALLAGGHALIEDVPGSGKTTLARAVARSLGGSFARIQATADLMPADITGSGVWNAQTGGLGFVPGPVFANVLLVDELNRTPPRTQSAFLEAMDEHAVTVDGRRHALPAPFFVVATQNPFDQYGTYPLPEGQLDRFAVRITLGPLGLDAERQVVRDQLVRATVDDLGAVLSTEALLALREGVRAVHLADPVLDHALALVRATREHPQVQLGASSRAALALVRCAQARALLDGRDFVAPEDTKALAPAVLAHRLVLREAAGDPDAAQRLVQELAARLPVPLRA